MRIDDSDVQKAIINHGVPALDYHLLQSDGDGLVVGAEIKL